MMMSFD